MASRFHPRLATWFDAGIASGRFDVPSGRHIILNEFPRLMRESRLKASAGVDVGLLREFLVAINPNIMTVSDGSPTGIRHQLTIEHDRLPGLRKVRGSMIPGRHHEEWFVYTPPLDVMRQGWREIRGQLDLHAA